MARVEKKNIPVVTQENKAVRKKHPGFVNPNRGIEVAEGLNMQDVPREIIVQHMKAAESFWRVRFNQQYANAYGSQQSF